MKIKDYKCTCQHTDFTFLKKDKSHLGIYCSKCGKWYKWADKNEKRLWEMNKENYDIATGLSMALGILDRHISELKGDNKDER